MKIRKQNLIIVSFRFADVFILYKILYCITSSITKIIFNIIFRRMRGTRVVSAADRF